MALKISSHHCGMERSAGLPVWCKVCDCCRDLVAASTLHWYTQLTGSFLTNGATKKVEQYRIFFLGQSGVLKTQSMLWDIFFGLILSLGNRVSIKTLYDIVLFFFFLLMIEFQFRQPTNQLR